MADDAQKAESDEDSPAMPTKPRKRPRETAKTVNSVLTAFESPPDLETMRALLRKTNRSYQDAFGDTFPTAIESASDVAHLMPFYKIYCDAKAVETLGKCLLYYKQAHNFIFSTSDDKVIARAAGRPTKCSLAQVKNLFDHYLRDLEQVHQYYTKRQPKPPTVKRAMLPYNCFVKDQWLLRAEEFKAIPADGRFAAVNKILTAEWKLPETRQRYA
jgi:hypothetical protein